MSVNDYGITNLPAFLVGVPMTTAINWGAAPNLETFTFDTGDIHAYAFRKPTQAADDTGTQLIYSGTKYGTQLTNVVYKYYANASFLISGRSYVWFFTKTPLAIGQAVLNAA
jgi:hypothetical protein